MLYSEWLSCLYGTKTNETNEAVEENEESGNQLKDTEYKMKIMINISKDLYEKIKSHNVPLPDIDVLCQSVLDGDIYQEQLDTDHDRSHIND